MRNRFRIDFLFERKYQSQPQDKKSRVKSILLGIAWEWVIMPAFFIFLAEKFDPRMRIPVGLPVPLKYPLAGVFFIAGVFFTYRSIHDIMKQGKGTFIPQTEPPKELVTTGVYRICRNPMYLGYLALFAGLGLAFSSPSILLVLVPGIVLFLFGYTRLIEEKVLTRYFGEAYLRYKKATPFLIPHFWIRRR
jgi:protein-S-isoprenylcysteine O-methyltransferase Ste14